MNDDLKKFVQEKLKQAAVRVYLPTSLDHIEAGFRGTGFFITTDGYILTAWHCIKDFFLPFNISVIKIKSYTDEILSAQLDEAKSIKELDIAVLKVDDYYFPMSVPLGLVEEKHEGNKVVSVAYPAVYLKGKEKIGVYSGEISRLFNDGTIEIVGIQGKGQSGGLIYHYATHRVIGIATNLVKKDVMANAGLATVFDALLKEPWLESNHEVGKAWDENISSLELSESEKNRGEYNPEFEELKDLEQRFTSEDFISPRQEIIKEFVEILDDNRLLVISGADIEEKYDFIQYLAWCLSKQGKRFNQGNTPAIFKWQHGSVRQIESKFQKSKNPSIYLFIQVSPQEVGPEFLSIIKNASTSTQHCVIVTTERHKDVWKLSEEEENLYWKEFTTNQLYNLNDLIKALFKAFKKEEFQDWNKIEVSLQQQILKTNFDKLKEPGNLNLVDHFTFQKITEKLQTPKKITLFVNVLYKELQNKEQELNEAFIDKLIGKIQASHKINYWYYHILNSREQLLALGLNLFSGLREDQFFAALEEVVENVWQKRNPDLQALDYCDLDNLRNFFTIPITKDSRSQEIKSDIPRRSQLFKVAWKCHGRQILATLPIITNLVKNSVANRSFHSQLYGTQELSEKIQTVLTETVSEIGYISPIAVRDTLRQFAADNEREVQEVAVYAIARWYALGREKELFEILNAWLNECASIPKKQENTQNQEQSAELQESDYIRTTVALTIGYATKDYDLPNAHKHSESYYHLLKQLSDLQKDDHDDHPAYVSFCSYLPIIVSRHFAQQPLRDSLCYMAQYRNLVGTISDILAKEYQTRPKEVLDILETWQQNQDNRLLIHSLSAREHLLSTIALSYGKIDCNENVYPFSATQAFKCLQDILQKGILVRQAVITAIGMKLRQKFEEIEPLFFNTIPQLVDYEHEYQKIVDILTVIYLEQNAIQGSNLIEIAMHRWVKNENNPIAQNIALQASVNFILIPLKKIKTKQVKTKFLDFSIPPKPIHCKELPYRLKFSSMLTLWIVTWRRNKSYKNVISNLLYEARKHYKEHQYAIIKVLSRWKETKNDNEDNNIDIVTLSILLRSSLWYLDNFRVILGGIGGISLLILIYITNIIVESQYLPNDDASELPSSISTKIPEFSQKPQTPKPKAMIDTGINLLVANKADVLDIDSTNFDGGKLIIKFTENATGNDRLGIRTGTEAIDVKGKYNEKQEVVYEVFHHNRVIGYFKDDNTLPLEITLTANATKAEAKALVHSFAYQNTSNNPQLRDRKIELQLTDGDGGISNAFSKTISVVTENEAPVITIPDEIKAQTIRETQKFSLSGISLTDVESQELTVTLQVKNGKLTVKQNVPKGLKSKNIRHAEQVILKGNIEQINTTLANSSAITYQSHLGFSGKDFLQIAVFDSGKKITSDDGLAWPPGAIDSKKTTKILNITVIPAIILTVPSVQTVEEDTNLIISSIHIEAPDSKNATVTLEVSNGTLTIKDDVANGVNRRNIQGNKTAKVTLTGTIEQLNTTLKDLTAITYRGHQNFNGIDTLTITGKDSNKFAHKQIKIQINAINDGPEISEVLSPPPIEPVVHLEPPVKKEVYGIVTTKRDPLNIREWKSKKMAKIIGQAQKGERLLILEQNGAWCKVQLNNGKTGYASSDYITIQSSSTSSISPTSQRILGIRAKNRADTRYKRLSSPSPRKWWNLVCRTMDEVYNQEVAKTKTTRQQDKRKIWQKVFNGTVDVIHQDERKKRGGKSRNWIKNKISTVCK